jgi:hypothetical protein
MTFPQQDDLFYAYLRRGTPPTKTAATSGGIAVMKPISWRALFLVVAGSLAYTAASAETVYDDFKTKWRPLQFGSGTSAKMIRNRLEMSLSVAARGDGRDFFGEGLASTCALSGDFDLRASFRLLEWPLHNGVRVALHLGTNTDIENGGVYIERDSYSDADADDPIEVYVFYSDEGQILVENQTEDMSGLLRLRRVASIVTGYYRSNAEWVELGSSEVGTQNLPFALFVYSHDSVFADSFVKAAFESVRLASGSFSGAACPFPTS